MRKSQLLLPVNKSESISISWPAWSTFFVSPLLYSIAIPLIFFEFCLELYHRIGFPILGISLVNRWEYICIVRHRLFFLPIVLKLACAYCGYANGLLQYAVRIDGDTETYFCPMKHQHTTGFHPPVHHRFFVNYDHATEFQRRMNVPYLFGTKDKKRPIM